MVSDLPNLKITFLNARSEQLTSSINEIFAQVARAAEVANKAVKQTKESNERIAGLAKNAESIGKGHRQRSDGTGWSGNQSDRGNREMSKIATVISAAVEEQAAATQKVASNIIGVNSASENSNRLVGELLQATDRLTGQASA
tara:strand:+ start:11894 stop:12322 length:429 start_codon:yes stop_codon:yes gene_type:complete